jgi:ribose transport system substrate-binding protein
MRIGFKSRRFSAAIAVLALAALGAGCGSSSSSSSSSGTSTGSSGGSSTSSGSSSIVQSAKADVAASQLPDTTWRGPTTSPKPATNKTVYVISCSPDTEGCQRDVRAAVAAAQAIGWTAKRLDSDGTPANFVSLMDQAINAGANGIIDASFPIAAIQQPLNVAASKGIPVVSMLSGNPAQAPDAGKSFKGGFFTEVNTSSAKQGVLSADWIISQTNAKATVGEINEPAFPIQNQRVAAFRARFKECSGCTLKPEIDVPVAQLASNGTTAIANFLQANPDVNYFWATYDGAGVFANQAIHQVGRANSLPMIGIDGNSPNLNFMRKGDVQVADVVSPHEWIGWAAVDQMNRAFNHQPPAPQWEPGGGGIVTKLLVKSNLPPNGKPFTGDINFQAKFKQLWGK